MEYILLIIAFLSTITAVIGKTKKNKEEGKKGITKIGYITLTLGFLALLLSSISKCQGNKKKKIDNLKKEEKITELTKLAEGCNDTINQLNKNILRLNDRVDVYEKILSTIKDDTKELEFMEKTTLADAYYMKSGESVSVSGTYFSGTIIKLMGQRCSGIILEYSGKRVRVPTIRSYDDYQEIPIVGRSGESHKIRLRNTGTSDCGLKVYAKTTKRIDSDKWSWEGFEELEAYDIEALIGNYSGTLDSKKISLEIENIDGQVVIGKNTVGENTRPIKGAITKNSNEFKLILLEPGDDKWDGKFEIQISNKRGEVIGEGTWKSFNGKLKRTIKLKKK